MTKSVDIFTLAQQCWPSDRRMWSVDADLPRLARFAELVAIATAEAYTQAADQAAAAHKVERDELREALKDLIALAEEYEVKIDKEWGMGRSLEEIDNAGDLPYEITNARETLK